MEDPLPLRPHPTPCPFACTFPWVVSGLSDWVWRSRERERERGVRKVKREGKGVELGGKEKERRLGVYLVPGKGFVAILSIPPLYKINYS